MASKMVRSSECLAASVVILLGLSSLVSGCSSSPQQAQAQETTGSVPQTRTSSYSGTTLPPVIQAPQTTPARNTAYTSQSYTSQGYTTQSVQPARQVNYVQPPAYAQSPGYARRQPVRRQVCNCNAPVRYNRNPPPRYNGDVTASIPQPQPTSYTHPMRFVVHTIEPNETLYSISRRYHSNVNDVAAVNRMNADSRLRFGELLVIPTR
jgi:LysM repeat protein